MMALGLAEMPPVSEQLGVDPHEYLAIRYHQTFRSQVLSRFPEEGWEIDEEGLQRLIMAEIPTHGSA